MQTNTKKDCWGTGSLIAKLIFFSHAAEMYLDMPYDHRRIPLKRIYKMPEYYRVNDMQLDADLVSIEIVCKANDVYCIKFIKTPYQYVMWLEISDTPFYIVCAVLKQYSSKEHIDVSIMDGKTIGTYQYRIGMYSITTKDKGNSELVDIFVARYNEYLHTSERRYRDNLTKVRPHDCKIDFFY
jgi:hypothetical protein